LFSRFDGWMTYQAMNMYMNFEKYKIIYQFTIGKGSVFSLFTFLNSRCDCGIRLHLQHATSIQSCPTNSRPFISTCFVNWFEADMWFEAAKSCGSSPMFFTSRISALRGDRRLSLWKVARPVFPYANLSLKRNLNGVEKWHFCYNMLHFTSKWKQIVLSPENKNTVDRE
jgi:hypothetical protein